MKLAAPTKMEVDEALLEDYSDVLEDLSVEQLLLATKMLRRQSKFFPAASEFYEVLGIDTKPPSIESQAITALNNLMESLDENRPSVAWPVTRHIADKMGGHQALWAMSQREFDFKRREFIKTYIALAECEPEKLQQLEALSHVPNSRLPALGTYKPMPGNITNGRLSHDC